MRNRERIVWIVVVGILLVVTTASGISNWIQAGNTEKTYKQLRLFNEVFNLLRTEYYDESRVQPEQLVPGAINGMIKTLDDPHTSYFSKEHFDELKTDTKGEFGGLGIVIGLRDGWITVISPIDDTPAYRAGIMAGDRIVEIDGESTDGFTTMDAVKLLRGEVGTDVSIKVKRRTEEEPLPFTSTRGVIKLETVKSTVIDDHIGYVRRSQFSEPTADALRTHMEGLRKQGLQTALSPVGILRLVKSTEELAKIRCACRLAAQAVDAVRSWLRPGVTEKQTAVFVEVTTPTSSISLRSGCNNKKRMVEQRTLLRSVAKVGTSSNDGKSNSGMYTRTTMEATTMPLPTRLHRK